MACQLGAGTVSTHAQKLSPEEGTLGWLVRKEPIVFFKKVGGVFSVQSGEGEGKKMGFSSLSGVGGCRVGGSSLTVPLLQSLHSLSSNPQVFTTSVSTSFLPFDFFLQWHSDLLIL